MDINYTEGLLLSDLLCLYNLTGIKKYLEELKNRMFFCGFTIEEIAEYIEFENHIFNVRNEKYKKHILTNYFIFGKKENTCIFDNVDSYMYNPSGDNKRTLMSSELISIIDEAIFLSYSNKINSYKSRDEIIKLSIENSSNWLFFEFKNRIEYICRCANHIINGPKKVLFAEKTNILYDNEMQICLRRWNVDVSSKNFIPYTQQYFD